MYIDKTLSPGNNPSPSAPISRQRELPASTGQQRIWYITQIAEPKYVYNDQMEVRIGGLLDIRFLERCLNKIIERYEALRTVFRQTDSGDLMQVIIEPFSIEVPLIPVGINGMDSTELEREISRESLEQGQAEYNLSTGPLFRVSVLQLPDNIKILLFSFHHIIMDGRSLTLLLREINTLYAAESQGIPGELDQPFIQDTNYACSEQQWMKTNVFEQRLNYWKKQLETAPPLLDFPFDYPRPVPETAYGAWEYFQLPKKLTKKLSILARKKNVSLYIILLAAYKTLLMRYSGQTELLIAAIIANRPHKEMENLMGFFAETAILHSRLSADKTFNQLLPELQSLTTEAFYNQVVPFNELVNILRHNSHSTDAPLCQAALVYKSIPFDDSKLAGKPISHPTLRPMGIAKFDMTLSLKWVTGRLEGYFEYNTHLLNASTVRRFLQHYQSLLESVVENPNKNIAKIPFLIKKERQQILHDWNKTAAPYPQKTGIHHLFEATVESTPKATAVIYGNQQLTYDELNNKSNQLAYYLVAQGVGPETRVGLYLERSFEMIIGILGILKAGGAYVPLDADCPLKRLGYMIENSELSLVLTQASLLEKLPPLFNNDTEAIVLDQGWQAFEQAEAAQSILKSIQPLLKQKVQPHHLAYVIYTSGCTGKPKGVMVNHESALNTLHFLDEHYPVKQNDAYLLKTNCAFDVSLAELFACFTGGGRLVILPPEAEKSPDIIMDYIETHHITHINFVPPMLSVFVEEARKNQLFVNRCPLKYLMVTGEAFPKPLMQTCVELFTSTAVENMYGPTEASIYSARYSCPKEGIHSKHTPIGRPLSNTQLYVVDKFLQPVPIDAPGELCIAGAGLARGYLNQPELTAAAFIDNPFNPGTRLYKTGDKVRYLADGNIEYIGRIDHQIKVRGFRIEPIEIEEALIEQQGIREAIVIAHSHSETEGTDYLVAYIVYEQGFDTDQNVLRNTLSTVLPDYMLPSCFVVLDKLPLMPNGKVDRKALPAPDASVFQTPEYVAPSTDIEHSLVEMWAALLNIPADKIGTNTHFIALGGHSLLATRLVSRINKKFNIELKIRGLSTTNTIQPLAEMINGEINNRQLAP